MKQWRIILSIIFCLTLLAGCSTDITIRDDGDSSIPQSSTKATQANDAISDIVTSTTLATSYATADSSTKVTSTAITSTSKKSASKSANTTTSKPITKSSSAANSTTTTTKAKTTTTTKKDHGTPNISGTFHTDMADVVLTKLNAARKAEGLNELIMDRGNMMNAAKIRAKEITIHWAHERPDKASWDTVYNEEGVKFNARGENLADGYTTADAVFQGWMNSPGHKANIMEPRFTHISIVCLEHEGHFYWVQLFGANIR